MKEKEYLYSSGNVLRELKTQETGLTQAEAESRLSEYGPNKLKDAPKATMLQRFLAQLKDPMLLILMAAAGVSAVTNLLSGESLAEVFIILIVVLLNAGLGVLQESKAEAAIEALQTMTAATCKVYRGGQLTTIHSDELVPGDVVALEAGDSIPADGRLLESASLKIEEAALTGESVPVNKVCEALEISTGADVPLGDRKNMCYMGSTVVYGRGKAVVTRTGMNTEMGKIAGALANTEEEQTPLQKKLDELGRTLSKLVLGICVFIFIFDLVMAGSFTLDSVLPTFMVAVSLAVAAIPEGLATVVTVALSIGVTNMSKRNAVIRRLTAVETLGCTQVICSDKTGTLTQNRMTVVEHIGETALLARTMALCSDAQLNAEGKAEGEPTEAALVAFAAEQGLPKPELEKNQPRVDEAPFDSSRKMMSTVHRYGRRTGQSAEGGAADEVRIGQFAEAVLDEAQVSKPEAGCIADEAWVRQSAGAVSDEAQVSRWAAGDSNTAQISRSAVDVSAEARFSRFAEDASEKAQFVQYTKGAPDEILKRCTSYWENGRPQPMTEEKRRSILAVNKQMADKALRVLAASCRFWETRPEQNSPEYLEQELCFVGLTGMIDPVRPEVKPAIAECREAGIRPVMITGDHRDTAVAIAKELGIIENESQAITGAQLDEMSEEEFSRRIADFGVYARVQPEHKVRIVKAWKKNGAITAMTGDGVNDAPSIKSADIGVGMGVTGTDVTKNVADMVLADDNFATIVNAVGEGRRIYDNIRKAIQFLLASNMSEVLGVFVSTLLGFTLLNPVHLLFINLITDCFPALALGMEKEEDDIMKRPPRRSDDGIFAGGLGVDVIYQGMLITVITIASYIIGHCMEVGHFEMPSGVSDDGMTMAFLTMNMCEIFHSFNMRSQRKSVFSLHGQNRILWAAMAGSLVLTTAVLEIPLLANAFGFTPISLSEYVIALLLAVLVIPVVEIVKAVQRALRRSRQSVS